MKTASVRLWRFRPPFAKTVILHQITVQGFMDLVRIWVEKISRQRIEGGKPLTGEAILTSDSREQFIASADLFVRDESPGWFTGWATEKNAGRMIRASAQIHSWGRLFGCLNLTGVKRKGTGLMGDVITLSRIWGVDPTIILEWPMERFLDVVDSMAANIEQSRRAEDPTLDPEAEPAPLGGLGIPGLEVVH